MLKIYNTLGKKKEIFKPLRGKVVSMYNCGPTVYDYAHIGNLRSYLMADLIRRYLEYKGYKVKQVKNITDVGHLTDEELEDKMIVASRREKKSPEVIARFYEKAFKGDEKKLNIEPACVFPRATEHISEMLEMIKKLLKNGFAYERNGSVFYNVAKFKGYGKLSGNTLEDLEKGARLEPHPDKIDPYDFALWLKAEPGHLMKWPSPWSKGYPGWHIECSAMSTKYLRLTFDIHTGGEDNIFPHHENEIAQSEGANGKKFVRYWVHARHLLVDGEKMSKSKGNFYTLADLLRKGYNPLSFRLLVLGAHHRSQLNFTWESLKQAEVSLEKIYDFIRKISQRNPDVIPKPKVKESRGATAGSFASLKMTKVVAEFISASKKQFEKYLDDDFNVPRGLAVVFDLINRVNKIELNVKESEAVYKLILNFDRVLGLDFDKIKEIKVPEKINKLLQKREEARNDENWQRADEIRKKIEKEGYLLEDSKKGPLLKPRTHL